MDRLSVSNRAGSLGRSALTEQLSASLLNKIAARDGREYNEMSRQRLGLFDFYASKFFLADGCLFKRDLLCLQSALGKMTSGRWPPAPHALERC